MRLRGGVYFGRIVEKAYEKMGTSAFFNVVTIFWDLSKLQISWIHEIE
jgi:hypothetical protein